METYATVCVRRIPRLLSGSVTSPFLCIGARGHSGATFPKYISLQNFNNVFLNLGSGYFYLIFINTL